MTARAFLLLIALVGVAGFYAGGSAKERALMEAIAKRDVERLIDTVRVRDTVYRRDTIRFRSVLARYDSTRVTDTIVVTRHDTAVVYVERAAADAAIQSCQLVVRSCESRVVARDSVIAAKDRHINALNAASPGFIERWGYRALWGWIGFELGKAAKR